MHKYAYNKYKFWGHRAPLHIFRGHRDMSPFPGIDANVCAVNTVKTVLSPSLITMQSLFAAYGHKMQGSQNLGAMVVAAVPQFCGASTVKIRCLFPLPSRISLQCVSNHIYWRSRWGSQKFWERCDRAAHGGLTLETRGSNFIESSFESSFELLEFLLDDILLQQ